MPDQLTSFLQRYQHLRTLRDSGRMPPQQFAAEVQKLRWQDASGAWWMVDANGVALRYDGQQWQSVGPPPPPAPAYGPPPPPAAAVPRSGRRGAAPQAAAPQAAAPQGAAPARAPAPNPTAAKARRFVPRALLPILPLIPVLLCGGSWFFYTFLGVFKYEGTAGVDWITPLIIVGLPALFWLLDKPLDQLFMPLKPVIQGVPKALRLGICIAIPIVLGLALGALSDSGYGMLRFTSLVSVLAAAVLLRF
ncbi:MAG: hypothetical protein RBT75_02350 [Anaerolineae bacterium]|nr:hypothetical protein [Anaerolineae bacterium]